MSHPMLSAVALMLMFGTATLAATDDSATSIEPAAAPPAGVALAVAASAAPTPKARNIARTRGPVTGLPLPRYVSMKASKANVRRGPSLTHRIDWVFVRRDMPLQIVAEHGHWRRVRDRDGMGGWVHYSLLSGTRTAIVTSQQADLQFRPDSKAPVTARLETGVVARLGECVARWCRLTAGGYRGWTPKEALWGVGAEELRD
ncbi:SH3 domain-containing protein [Pseudooceanicola aestuarii]|uniref:SH3 domain-containing protein n=1 Tax=Pseudooceanicola aestuarii TaxID=2697319 RepID=UPI0013D851C9|nr:SH3 domain-containing protein [Pseudooceanicola aestuarii]